MKKILLAGVAITALAVAAPANAADLRMPVKAAPIAAPAPYFSWTGCYVGAHIGWGWGTKDWNDTAFSDDIGVASTDVHGPIFGGQIGCDYQFNGVFVVGLEYALAATDIWGDTQKTSASTDKFLHARTDWISSVTGRLGWTGQNILPGNVLVYIKGGVAWAHDRFWTNDDGFPNGAVEETRSGWTLGGGIEWTLQPVWPNWTVRLEYLHYDFGDSTVCCFAGNDPTRTNISQTIDTVTLGLNYRFGWFLGKGPLAARY